MKTFLFIGFHLALVYSLSAQKNKITELISYRVSIQLDTLTQPRINERFLSHEEYNQYWFKDKIEYPLRTVFVEQLHKKVIEGKVQVLQPFFDLNGTKPIFERMTAEAAYQIGLDSLFTTLYREYPPYDPFDTVFVTHFNADDIVQIEFMEIWTYNKYTMQIKKKLIAYAPIRREYFSATGEYIGVSVMYWIPVRKRLLKVKSSKQIK